MDVDLAEHTWQVTVSGTNEEQSRRREDRAIQTAECGEHHEHRHRPTENAENAVSERDGDGIRLDNLCAIRGEHEEHVRTKLEVLIHKLQFRACTNPAN